MGTTSAQKREMVLDLLGALDEHDTEAPREICAEAYDYEALIATWEGLIEAFPDLSVEVHELGVDGDWVIARFHLSGTHKETFWGLDPTGNEFEVQEHVSYKVSDYGIEETHATFDGLDLLAQLDVELPIDT